MLGLKAKYRRGSSFLIADLAQGTGGPVFKIGRLLVIEMIGLNLLPAVEGDASCDARAVRVSARFRKME